MPIAQPLFIFIFALMLHYPFASLHALEQPQINVYGYHSAPPFVTNSQSKTGLSYEMVRYLNRMANGKLHFHYRQIDRAALNQLLANDQPAIVLWATHMGFGGNHDTQYLWSPALFNDSEVIVVSRESPLIIRSLSDLEGKVLAARDGYRYDGIDKMVSAGHVTRINSSSDKLNLERVIKAQAHFSVISKSSLLYFSRQSPLVEKLKLAPFVVHKNQQRHLLVTHHYSQYFAELNGYLEKLSTQTGWVSHAKLYGLQPLLIEPSNSTP